MTNDPIDLAMTDDESPGTAFLCRTESMLPNADDMRTVIGPGRTPAVDKRPSIAELRRLETEQSDEEIASDGHICTECRVRFFIEPDLETSTMCNPCAQRVTSDVLPVLLEIAAAALALRAQMTVAAKCRAVIHRNHYAGDAAYVAVDTADTELARCQSMYEAALAKVRP